MMGGTWSGRWRRTAVTPTCVVATSLWVIGCGDADRGTTVGQEASVRDSAGVQIIDLGFVDYDALPTWELAGTPQLTVGTLDGPAEQLLGRVTSAKRTSDGGVVLFDQDSHQVRRYDTNGDYLWSQGREGDGPGEHHRLTTVWLTPGDSVVAWGALGRFNLLAPAGERVQTERVEPGSSGIWAIGWADRSTVWAMVRHTDVEEHNEWHYLIWNPRFHLAGTDGTDSGPLLTLEERFYYRRFDQFATTEQKTFAPAGTFATDGMRLWYARGDAYELSAYDTAGVLDIHFRWNGPERKIPPGSFDLWRDWYSGPPTFQQKDALYRSLRDWPVADSLPAYDRLLIDRAGRVWVRDYVFEYDEDSPRSWTILETDPAAALGRLTHPASFEPMDIGEDWILGKHEDELEIESVLVFEIVR